MRLDFSIDVRICEAKFPLNLLFLWYAVFSIDSKKENAFLHSQL